MRETFDQATVANMVQSELQNSFFAPEDTATPPPQVPDPNSEPPPLMSPTTLSSNDSGTVSSELTMQTMQQQLAVMQQMLFQQMALTQQPMCQLASNNSESRPRRKCKQMKYCWTHGKCNHWGKDC